MSENNPPKIGLALGSGSARGWAHIGVIQALEEANIPIHCIAGCSIGALEGAIYASGNLDRLSDLAPNLDWRKISSFFDLVFPKSGLVNGKKVARFVRDHIRETNIEDLPIRFCAVATDLDTGEEVHLVEGDIIEAVRASISVPGVFTPVKIGDRCLIDGGMANPLPVNVAREMGADFVIAVDINHDIVTKKGVSRTTRFERRTEIRKERRRKRLEKAFGGNTKLVEALNDRIESLGLPRARRIRPGKEKTPNIFDVLTTAVNIMEARITAARLAFEPADLLIQPDMSPIRFLEFHRAQEAIDAGYAATKERMGEIEILLGKPDSTR
jgi:NTE family protein